MKKPTASKTKKNGTTTISVRALDHLSHVLREAAPPLAEPGKPWTPVHEGCGVQLGESPGAALRRNAAELEMVREGLDQGGDVVEVSRDLLHITQEILRLSLEVDELAPVRR